MRICIGFKSLYGSNIMVVLGLHSGMSGKTESSAASLSQTPILVDESSEEVSRSYHCSILDQAVHFHVVRVCMFG